MSPIDFEIDYHVVMLGPRVLSLSIALLCARTAADSVAVDASGRWYPTLPQQEASTADAELQRSVVEHDEKCAAICHDFYCGPVASKQPVAMDAYAVSTPSIDFPDEFEAGSGSKIYVTKEPLFTPQERDETLFLPSAQPQP